MDGRIKIWVGIGAWLLASTSPVALSASEGGRHDVLSKHGVNGSPQSDGLVRLAAEGGEGGEGGERGFDPSKAAREPAVFLAALDVIRAHYLAGLAILEHGNRDAAGEMFAHPISEVYVDLAPTFKGLGVPAFMEEMAKASEMALEGVATAAVHAMANRVLDALRAAESHAPRSQKSSVAVNAGVLAEMIDRAALLYLDATSDGPNLESWLDGYGYFKAAEARAKVLGSGLTSADPIVAQRIEEAMALLARAFPKPTPIASPPVEPSALLAASSRVTLAVGKFRQ